MLSVVRPCCFAVPGCVSRQWARVGVPAPCWCGQRGEGEEVLPPNPATTEGPHPPSETGRSVDTPGSCSDVVQRPGWDRSRKVSNSNKIVCYSLILYNTKMIPGDSCSHNGLSSGLLSNEKLLKPLCVCLTTCTVVRWSLSAARSLTMMAM